MALAQLVSRFDMLSQRMRLRYHASDADSLRLGGKEALPLSGLPSRLLTDPVMPARSPL